MKERTKPKIFCRKDLYLKHDKIGYIQLASYLRGEDIPHLEFSLDDKYHNQKIMSRELPKYLKEYRKYHNRLMACVKKDNIASLRILITNKFTLVTHHKDNSECHSLR